MPSATHPVLTPLGGLPPGTLAVTSFVAYSGNDGDWSLVVAVGGRLAALYAALIAGGRAAGYTPRMDHSLFVEGHHSGPPVNTARRTR